MLTPKDIIDLSDDDLDISKVDELCAERGMYFQCNDGVVVGPIPEMVGELHG